MTRTAIIFLLITGLLAKKYLIEVANEGRDKGDDDEGGKEGGERGAEGEDGEGSEGGSDFSFNNKLRMVVDGGRRFRSQRSGAGGVKKYVGDTLTLTCNVGSFL